MQSQVVAHGADVGIALDGDADRLIVADEKGEILNGDQLMGAIALSWHAAGLLKGGGICATVMSNLGLERKLAAQGIKLWRAAVGDRYVLEEMRRSGCNLGGEQSGHIILSDFATTGDGLLAALQVLALLAERKKRLSEVGHVFEPLPQILKSVRYSGGAQPLDNPQVQQVIASGEATLNGKGRLVIRKSGTEPLIRVMGEGEDEALVSRVVADIVAAVQAAA